FLLQLCLAWLASAAAVWLAATCSSPWVSVLAVVWIATRQNILALLVHEQCHWLAFRNRRGEWLCNICAAWPLLISVESYRGVHLAHHQHYFTDRDPDYRRKQGGPWSFPQHPLQLARTLLCDVLGLNVWRTLAGKHGDPSARRPRPWLRLGYYAL